MNSFFKNFIFIILFIIYFVNSLEATPIWENNYKTSSVSGFSDGEIVSYAFDGETGAEIFLKKNNAIVYNSKEIFIYKYNITYFQNQIIELNSYIYFCSSSKILLWIKDATIESINNPVEIKDQNYTIKCFRGDNCVIAVFLGTKYFSLYHPGKNKDNYFKTFSFSDNKIIAFNNYTEGSSNEYLFTLLSKDDKNYYFDIFKIQNDLENIIDLNRHNIIPIDNLTLYENIEIVALNRGGIRTYLFTYDNLSGNFSFYIVGLEQGKNYIDGRYYFRFFNNFKIKYAKFIEKTAFLYYSIENLRNDHKKYIGLADLEYYLLLYNIEANVDNLYFNYGNFYQNKGELFYFLGNKKISYCPFIEGIEGCSYNYLYFDITKNGEFYNNSINNKCENKKILGRYCVSDCTIGYSLTEDKNDNNCQYCNVLLDRFIFYKTKACQPFENCVNNNYKNISGICYNCGDENKRNTDDNRTKYYNQDYNILCTDSCDKVNAVNGTEENTCKSCKSDNLLYSLKNKVCINIENCIKGEKDLNSYTCEECEFFGKLYFEHDDEQACVENCPFLYGAENNECIQCNQKNQFYEEGECLNRCSEDKGYGKMTQIIYGKNKTNVTYCMKCMENETFKYLDFNGEYCINDCGQNLVITSNVSQKCTLCNESFYVENAEICLDHCPDGWSLKENSCVFCGDRYYYNGECLSECKTNQYSIDINYTNQINFKKIEYHKCEDCEPPNKVIDSKCRSCNESFYNTSDEQCYSCFCGADFYCKNSTSQCDCDSDPHFFGENCEFWTKNDKNQKIMKIVSLNNKLIKTSKNYFTYILTDNITLPNDYSFEWKVLLNGTEITGDKKYQNYFITSTNEAIFGINKELFEKPYNKTIELSLNIISNSKIELSDNITLLLINSFEYDNKCNRGYSGNLGLYEMKSNFVLENIKSNNTYNGRYLSQYRLLDYDNEKMPITNYIDTNDININLICSKGYDISTLNDLEEKQDSSLIETRTCSHSNLNFDEILYGYFTETEKMFLLISYLRKIQIIDDIKFKNITDFINERISILINENGYYIEKNNNKTDKSIIYSEPKLIFSLINNLAYKSKNLLTEKNFSLFFNFTKNIFENNNLSNKSLSESDIKSLFRTFDNLYDISIEKDLKSEVHNFIQLFDKITEFLSRKTYPSETIRLIGKRISILSHHFGAHQKSISFPPIDKMEERKIKDFLTYSYDNYFLNEDICSQKNPSLFCLTSDNFKDLKSKLLKKNYNLNNIYLNIYLMQEIDKNNILIIDDENDNYYNLDEILEKINLNKKYSLIFKFFIKDKDRFSLINDTEINIDVEFPFAINLTENITKEEKKNNNYFSDKNYFDKKGWNISLSINNSEYACIPKSFYENHKIEKNIDIHKIKNYCFTHFDYDKQKIRCSCKTKLNDEILVIKDLELSNTFKHMQFEKKEFNILNKYTLYIIYFLMILLLIPIIVFLIMDILKETKIINEKPDINELIEENNNLKDKYKEIKRYNSTGIFSFSLSLIFIKFPIFYAFNKHKNKYPMLIKHLIICIGFFIGFIIPLIPFAFLSFSEKQIFFDQRNINFDDDNHKLIKPLKYFIISIIFSIVGIILGNVFIYIFLKILNMEKAEINAWHKIKILCKDYVYEIKSDVLLGAIWKKIKLRIHAYYYICGNFILNKNKKKNKFSQYLKYISRTDDYKSSEIKGLEHIDRILPSSKNNNGPKNEPLLIKDEEEKLLSNNIIHDDNDNENNENIISTRKRNKNSLYSNSSETSKKYDFSNVKIIKSDNFLLDNKKYDKLKRQIERYEKIRNKYIYVSKKNLNENDDENEDKNIYFISRQINYCNLSIDSFHLLANVNNKEKESNKIVFNFVIISSILFTIFIILLSFMIVLLHKALQIFGVFILYVWIIPSIIIITIGNFIIYYLKILIGSILLFHYYHLKNKKYIANCLFWIFVDKTMMNLYKVRNLITKYKKEFDYLLN